METPPNSTPSDTAALPVEPSSERRKPRAVLSCITCRARKLRCDKGRPCHNCSKRHQPCRYYGTPPSGSNVPSASPGRHVKSTRELDRRLQHLEELLVLLNNQKDPKRHKSPSEPFNDSKTQEATSGGEGDVDTDFNSDASNNDKAGAPQVQGAPIPHATGGQVEAESGRWQAVLDDISELRSFLLREGPVDVMQRDLGDRDSLESPVLLLNTTPPPTKSDLLASIPPKGVVGHMISKVLNSGEPAVVILHVPTFMREYNEFWIHPESSPPAWLGKLFGLLCLAALFQRREGEALPSPLTDMEDTIDHLRVRAAQCLIVADYTRPGPHIVEALIVYMASEYFLSKDAQLGVSMIIGIIIRLAMSMGYHRDPSRDASISVFEGEMIRRRWTFLTQVERPTSFQMGLPTIVYRSQSDTRPPHNLLDTDINPSTRIIPPERPVRE